MGADFRKNERLGHLGEQDFDDPQTPWHVGEIIEQLENLGYATNIFGRKMGFDSIHRSG